MSLASLLGFRRAVSESAKRRYCPRFDILEDRCLPANLILDFAGAPAGIGTGTGPGTPFLGLGAAFNAFAFQPYQAVKQANGLPGNRTQQILQVVAGVRQDFAPFNVTVLWDDRGVNSPFFRAGDSVIYVVNNRQPDVEPGSDDLYGVAPGENAGPGQGVVAYVFEPTVLTLGTTTTRHIRELIDTASHEAGHTFGLDHATQRDSQDRQIVAEISSGDEGEEEEEEEGMNENEAQEEAEDMQGEGGGNEQVAGNMDQAEEAAEAANAEMAGSEVGPNGPQSNNGDLDSRFSPQVLPNTSNMGPYSELAFLLNKLGPSTVFTSATFPHTSQTLPNIPPGPNGLPTVDATATLLTPSAPNFFSANGRVDFFGDRTAFQFVVPMTGSFTITERAAPNSTLDPVLTLWDTNGDFVQLGTTGASGGVSTLTFNATAGQRFFAVAGSGYDQFTSDMLLQQGSLPQGKIGAFTLTIQPTTIVAPVTPPTTGNVVVYPLVPLVFRTTIFTPNAPDLFTSYVNGLYHTILGRAPDPAGQALMVNLLRGGTSPQTIIRGLWESPEHRGDQVDYYYEHFLGRTETTTERASWVSVFLAGNNEANVTLQFLNSAEYASLHPGNTGFLTGLYQDVLGRDPDAVGLGVNLQALQNGTSKADVIRAFQNSTESLLDAVDGFYLAFLGRNPDAVGAQNLLAAFQKKGGANALEAAATGFLISQEFISNAGLAV